jgi:murein peptide amidase A
MPRVIVLAAALVCAACSSTSALDADSAPSITAGRSTTTTAATTTDTPTTTTAAPTTTTTAAPTTTTTTAPTTTAGPTTTLPAVIETREIGRSVEGRPIKAVRRGQPGGRVVLVIGVIHGDEQAGLQIVDRLEELDVPAGIDLWLVDSMNPDGVAHDMRTNADQVDLNRNFPYNWGPIGQVGDWEYAGPGPASEPETQAMVAFITDIHPDLVIWYHQDYNRIAPGTGRDAVIRARYSELTGIPLLDISGGTYTGVAATWARHNLDGGVAFIVELGESLSTEQADVHARAVLTIASEDN